MSVTTGLEISLEPDPSAKESGQGSGRPYLGYSILAFVFIANLSLAIRPVPMLFSFPLSEDGYLSLTVARNLALGNGLSADGVNLTNGVQPLWVFLTSIPFAIFDGDRAATVRTVLVMSTVLMASAALLMKSIAYRLTGSTGVAWITLVSVCLSHHLLVQFFNGLETGLLVVCYAATIWLFSSEMIKTNLGACFLGIGLGLLMLIRIDTVFFSAFILLSHLIVFRHNPWQSLSRTVLAGCIAATIVVPWFAYNIWLTGSPMPVSGQSLETSGMGLASAVLNMGGAIIRATLPFFLGGISREWSILVLLVVLGICLRQSFKDRQHAKMNERQIRVSVGLFCLIAGTSVAAMYYTLNSGAPYFWPRYMTPLAVIGTLAVASTIHIVWKLNKPIALLGALMLLGPSIMTWPAWHKVEAIEGAYYSATNYRNPALLGQVDLAKRFRENDDVRVAAIQTGTLGFFVDGTYNLDGKVSIQALKARRASGTLQYMLDNEIELFVDFFAFTRAGNQYFDRDEFLQHYELIHPESDGNLYHMGVYRRIKN